jgi:hypothetical protein
VRPQTRKHPVGQLLSHAAAGELPTERDLDRLELSPAARRRVADAALVAVGIQAGGENHAARNHAADQAERIIGDLTPEKQSPNYLEVDDSPDDPAGLAEQVSRGW